jgi:hypothetical protein
MFKRVGHWTIETHNFTDAIQFYSMNVLNISYVAQRYRKTLRICVWNRQVAVEYTHV